MSDVEHCDVSSVSFAFSQAVNGSIRQNMAQDLLCAVSEFACGPLGPW